MLVSVCDRLETGAGRPLRAEKMPWRKAIEGKTGRRPLFRTRPEFTRRRVYAGNAATSLPCRTHKRCGTVRGDMASHAKPIPPTEDGALMPILRASELCIYVVNVPFFEGVARDGLATFAPTGSGPPHVRTCGPRDVGSFCRKQDAAPQVVEIFHSFVAKT